MSNETPPSFDLATVSLMRAALADAWGSLSPRQQAEAAKSVLAERILKAAAAGERDRRRLVEAALELAA